ncbi:DUF4322 domain-containing protein [Saccharolobus solfataricus]|uniref:First ORF in transposon ISC1160 n=3 Tax=Saccharolobus solfataricus TaxID=2287 RepID=Q97YM3_SACS2|nr:First ORF in transposon ISC1160 [Saccharolobus solfataricus P2]SAI84951.1 ORF1 in transposon ISC1160 [Saccharolobus solfataricus]
MIDFKGRKGKEQAKPSSQPWNDSIENKSKMFKTSSQTVRNYAEKEEVAEKLPKRVKQLSLEMLKAVKKVNISIDWTTIKYQTNREVR